MKSFAVGVIAAVIAANVIVLVFLMANAPRCVPGAQASGVYAGGMLIEGCAR